MRFPSAVSAVFCVCLVEFSTRFFLTKSLREKMGRGLGRSAKAALLCVLVASANVVAYAAPVTVGTKTAVGLTSTAQTVGVTFSRGGQLGSVAALTGGIPNLDFAISGAGDCSTGTTYTAGHVCHFPVTFQPKYPGQKAGALILLDASGAALGQTLLVSTGTGPLALFVPGLMSTVAGDQTWYFQGDGRAATASPIFLPYGIAVDPAGNFFIADSSNNRIRRVDGGSQVMTTVAGDGNAGSNGDGGLATAASVNIPTSVALDGAGNLYFADSNNHAIRKVDHQSGIIVTVAGILGTHGYSGNGGAATQALLNSPDTVAIDPANGLLYISDSGNDVVRRVDLATGIISAFAGNGTAAYTGDGGAAASASLNSPWGVTVMADGQVLIADLNNHCVRKVDNSGKITTIAGTGVSGFSGDGGAAAAAQLSSPATTAVDPAGNIYISDSNNNRIRKINFITGTIQTFAGSNTESFTGDGGPADAAGLYGPYALALDGLGNLYFSDLFHNRIRLIRSDVANLYYPTLRINRTSDPQDVLLENDGNSSLHISLLDTVSNSKLDPVATTCSTTTALSLALNCLIGVEFAPTVTGDPVLGTLSVVSDSANNPETINLSGKVQILDPTIVTLNSSGSPSATNSAVTFTSVVTSPGVIPTGSLTFFDGPLQIGSATLDGSGIGKLVITTLTRGTHNVVANYGGDGNNAPASSLALKQVVQDGTFVTFKANPSPANVNSPVQLSAIVTGSSGTPTGTIVFRDGTRVLGTVSLDNTGTATTTMSTFTVGTHPLTATYSGDVNSLPSASGTVNEDVLASGTTTVIATSNADAAFGTTIRFSANVSGAVGIPTGSVTFEDGVSILGSVTLDSAGNAALTTSSLLVGSHSIGAVYGGDGNNGKSSSAPVQQTIEQIATTTGVSSSGTPSASGASVTLTATVNPATSVPASPLTGSVTFKDGATTLGSAPISGGTALLTLSTLGLGSHSIVASFGGSVMYSSSASAVLTQTIQPATVGGTLSASANPLVSGKADTFTVTLSSNGTAPTGIVTFKDGATVLGTATLNAQGVATFTAPGFNAGTHPIVAVYAGDTFTLADSPALTLNVTQATTGVALATSGSPSTAGLSFTLSAVVTGTGATPTGTVSFLDGTNAIGSVSLNASGLASLPLSSLLVGSHSITAVYAGDANDASSTSPALTQVVVRTTTTTTVASSTSSSPLGDSVQFSGSVSSNSAIPGGNLQFFDGSTLLATVPLSAAGTATYSISSLIVGQHVIIATYAGDANDGPSSSAGLTHIVQPVTAIALVSNLNPASAGLAVSFTAAVTGSPQAATGLVTFHDGASILGAVQLNGSGLAIFTSSTLGVGTHLISASYPGDSNNNAAASASISEQVQRATTQTTLGVSAASATINASVVLTVSVTGSGATPGGQVTFSDGTTILGTGTLSANGTASLTLSNLPLGPHSLTASYAGDANDSPSSSTAQTLSVVKGAPSLTLASSNNPSTTGQAVTLSSILTGSAGAATGTISWTDGASTLGSSAVAANGSASLTLSTLSAGTHSILATYSGDANNSGAVANGIAQVVQQATSAVTLSSSKNPALLSDTVQLSIAVTGTGSQPGGVVMVRDGVNTVGTVTLDANGLGLLTLANLALGQHTLIASYAGDAVHSGSQAAGFIETVQQATSAVSLSSSSNPALVGQAVTLTISVSGTGAQPGGTVILHDGSNTVSTITLDAHGLGLYTSSTLSIGSHNLSASYGGDSLHTGSTSTTLIETVQQATSALTLTSNKNPALVGDAVTLTVEVTGTGVQPGGTVLVKDGPATIATLTLDANGIALMTTFSLTIGTHPLVATYAGDTVHGASQSAPLTQTVQQATSSVVLTSSKNPALVGDLLSFNVALTGTGAQPGGTVVLKDGTATLGTVSLDANGLGLLTTSTLSIGSHSLLALYAGDVVHGAAQSSVLSEVVQQATSATTLSASKNPSLVGDTVIYSMTVTGTGAQPGGIVTLTDGSMILGAVSVDANGLASLSLSSLQIGSHSLLATYPGDAIHSGSRSALLSDTVLQPTVTTLTSSSNPSFSGGSIILSAAVAGSRANPVTGSVTFVDGATTLGTSVVGPTGVATFSLSSLLSGQHSIVANYSGDSVSQSGSSAVLLQTVQIGTTTTALSSSATPLATASSVSATSSVFGAPITLTAQVSGAGKTALSGTVDFEDGTTLVGTAQVGANGIASLTTSSLATGQHILIAIYKGDGNNQTSTSTPLIEAIVERTTVALTSTLNPAQIGNPVTFSVTVNGNSAVLTPSGLVTLFDGANSLGSAPLNSSGVASFTVSSLALGAHGLVASYVGDIANLSAQSASLSETIQLHSSTNALTASSASVQQGQPLTLVATLAGNGPVPPSGSIVFSSGGTTLGSALLNASGIATTTVTPALGPYTIIATYQGDGIYTGSVSQPTPVQVIEPTHFTITLNPASLTLQTTQHSGGQVILTSIQGFTDTLALGCVGLPKAATCTFTADQVDLSANGTQTINVTIDTGSPLTAGSVAKNETRSSSTLGYCLLPGGLLLGFSLLRRVRANRMLGGLLLLLLSLGSLAISGCGGLDVHGTPAGTYTFNVTAIGAKTAATQSAPMTLTVTQ